MTPIYTVDRGLIACLELSNCSEMLYKKTTSEHLYSKMETGTWVGTSMSFIEELRRKGRALLATTCFIGAVLTVSTHMPHMQVKQSAHVNLHFSTFLRPWRNEIQLFVVVVLSLFLSVAVLHLNGNTWEHFPGLSSPSHHVPIPNCKSKVWKVIQNNRYQDTRYDSSDT